MAGFDPSTEDARTLLQKLALALLDDVERAGDVLPHINAKWGREAGDAVAWSNRGSHDPIPPTQLKELVYRTDRVTRSILSLARSK